MSETKPNPAHGVASAVPPKRRGRVLIVDDEPFNLRTLADILRPEFQVTLAKRGRDALELARRTPPPELILLDVVMPELDGYQVIQELKADPSTSNIPVIFITALDKTDEQEYGLGLGAIDYITKPIHPSLIRARVRNHINLARHRALIDAKERALRKDVQAARRFLQGLLPNPNTIPTERMEIAVHYEPSHIIGGDFYDVVSLDDHAIRVFVADAAGHGVQASLRTMVIKSVYDRLRESTCTPAEVLRRLNAEILRTCGDLICFTALCFDLYAGADGSSEMRYGIAGHPPLLCTHDGRARTIGERSSYLGQFESLVLSEGTEHMPPGTAIFAYTDGVIEQPNACGRAFGIRRLMRELEQCKGNLSCASHRVLESLRGYSDRTAFDDDLLLFAVKTHPAQS